MPVTKNIVRIGSRSKSTALDDFNLKNLIKKQRKSLRSRKEKVEEGRLHSNLKESQREGKDLCLTLAHGIQKTKWGQIASFLKRDFPIHYKQLVSETDEEGFEAMASKDGSFFEYWKQCKDIQNHETFEKLYRTSSSEDEAPEIVTSRELEHLRLSSDIWGFSRSERTRIIRHWEHLIQQECTIKLDALTQRHRHTVNELDTLNIEYKRRLLATADVIGLTTTGLAKNASLLERVQSKTLICEEAGEVLEVYPIMNAR